MGAVLNDLPILSLALIGVLAGLVGGLLGVGGGLVMIPALLFVLGDHFGPGSLHVYKLAALVTATLLSYSAARQHARAGATVGPVYRAMVAGAVFGVVVGAALASLFAADWTHVLRRIFGVFMVLVVGFEAYRGMRLAGQGAPPCRRSPVPWRRWTYGLVGGLPAGLLSGFLGIGGGIWAVPAQHYLLGVRLHNAIANSGTMIVVVAAVAAVVQWLVILLRMPDLDAADGWLLTLLLAPAAMLGGWLGATLTHRLPIRWLRRAFYALLAVAGARLVIG